MPNYRRAGQAVGGSGLDPRRRHSSGPTLDLEQFKHLEEIAETEDCGFQACNAPKDFVCGRGGELIYPADMAQVVKLACTNQDCSMSPFMHVECFEGWEEGVLNYLKSTGKLRSLTENGSKGLNLWSKKAYELAYKACLCSCMQGHLRKDLSWSPPANLNTSTDSDGERMKRRRRKNRNTKPTITIGLPNITMYNQMRRSDEQGIPATRIRTNSLSSSNSYSSLSSPATSPPSDPALPPPESAAGAQAQGPPRRTNHQLDRSRHDSGGSIFLRRSDYSSFNVLPRHKINSYHIKMEDECSIGNDETRCFILSSYATNKMNRVPCVLCGGLMNIFERYPLIDGTFFLSPRQHTPSCIQVKAEGRLSYLSAVCMGCLEGWNTSLHCRYCLTLWDGSQLILGTMYSYDIFAAVPCCADRLKCTACNQLVIHPEQRFNFFSDYSQTISCPSCGVQDFHFTKSLNSFVSREDLSKVAANNGAVSRTWAAAVRS